MKGAESSKHCHKKNLYWWFSYLHIATWSLCHPTTLNRGPGYERSEPVRQLSRPTATYLHSNPQPAAPYTIKLLGVTAGHWEGDERGELAMYHSDIGNEGWHASDGEWLKGEQLQVTREGRGWNCIRRWDIYVTIAIEVEGWVRCCTCNK